MHRVTVWFSICLLLASELSIIRSSTSESILHQLRLARYAREIRARASRQTRFKRQSRDASVDQLKCNYTIALLDFPPYVMNKTVQSERGFMFDKLRWFIETACLGRQTAEEPALCAMNSQFVENSSEMVKLIKNKRVDFAFPIFTEAQEALKDDPDVTIIRAFVSQGCSLIVNTKQCEDESRTQLLTSITSQWPILACIILLSGISGVVIWLLEHRTNNKHFSPSFTAGSPEGFWWAVVSLTTVGYGDKTPKTSLGRMFGVVWILVGAIMLSLFTALFTNAMQAALDGTKCLDIDSKKVGVSTKNPETQMVASEFEAQIIKFENLEEMQKNLSNKEIGRVLVDRNTAFYFLDKSGLKKSRKIRLIRNIDYPMDYFLAFVNKGKKAEEGMVDDMAESFNDTDEIADNLEDEMRKQMAECGPILKELSSDLVGVAKTTADERLIPAELQTADLSDEMEGLFSTESKMTSFILFCLLGIFGALVFIGISWEVYTKCNTTIIKRRKGHGSPSFHDTSEKGNLIILNKKMSMMQNFLEMEERLKDLTTELQRMKEEYANTIASGDTMKPLRQKRSHDNGSEDDDKRSFFDIFKNGKSKNSETVL